MSSTPSTPSKPPQPKQSLAERRGKEQPVLWTPSPPTPNQLLGSNSALSPPRSPLTSPPGYPTPRYSPGASPRVLIPASPTPRSPVPPPPVPLAPRCLTASATALNVGWDSAVGMVKVKYTLEWRPHGTSEPWAVYYSGPDRMVQVHGLPSGRKYDFRLTVAPNTLEGVSPMLVAVACSPPSAVATFATAKAPPEAVAPPTLSGRTDTELRLCLKGPSETGGAPVTQYRVQLRGPWKVGGKKRALDLEWVNAYVGSEAACTVGNLVPSSAYEIRATAANERGEGPWSGVVEIETAAPPPKKPSAPTAVSVTSLQLKSLTVSWAPPEPLDGGPVEEYIIQRAEVPSGKGQKQEDFAEVGRCAAPPFTSSGLPPGRAFLFRVSARNVSGAGPPSASSEGRVPRVAPETPPGAPSGHPEGSAVKISWDPPAETGGADEVEYHLQAAFSRSAGSDAKVPLSKLEWVQVYTGTKPVAFVTTLKKASEYALRVRASNPSGAGPFSGIGRTQSQPDEPGAPQSLALTGKVAANRVSLTWKPPSTDGGAAVKSYRIQYARISAPGAAADTSAWTDGPTTGAPSGGRGAGGGGGKQSAASQAKLSADVPALAAGASYTFRVQAVNPAGRGPWSAPVEATTPAAAPEAPQPPSLAAPAQPDALKLGWAPPTANGAPVSSYTLEMRMPGGEAPQWDVFYRGSGVAVELKGLDCDTIYEARVSATNAAGTSFPSPVESFRTAPGPPGPPRGLVVGAGGSPASLTVRWLPPAESHGAPVTSYSVELTERSSSGVASSSRPWRVVARTRSTAAVGADGEIGGGDAPCEAAVSGLDPGAHVLLRVRAANSAGEGPVSEALPATLHSAPPSAPAAPTFSAVSCGGARARWGEPPCNGSPITNYRLEIRRAPSAPASASRPSAKEPQWAKAYSGPARDFKLSKLSPPAAAFELRVQAFNAAGGSAFGATGVLKLARAPPRAPGAPLVDSSSEPGVLVVSWPPSPDQLTDRSADISADPNTPREPFAKYTLEVAPASKLGGLRRVAAAGGSAPAGHGDLAPASMGADVAVESLPWRVMYDGTERRARLEGLSPGATVLLRVHAHDSCQGSSPGPVSTASVPQPPPPPLPPPRSASSMGGHPPTAPPILEDLTSDRRISLRSYVVIKLLNWAGVSHVVHGPRAVVKVRYRALLRLCTEYAQWAALLGVLCLYAWLVLNENVENGKMNVPMWSKAPGAAEAGDGDADGTIATAAAAVASAAAGAAAHAVAGPL